MKRYKRNGVRTILGGIIIGSMPSINGNPAEATIKTNAITGLSNISSTFPAQGKLIGTGIVLKHLNKLKLKKKRR